MKVCQKCGTQNSDGSNFCVNCATPLNTPLEKAFSSQNAIASPLSISPKKKARPGKDGIPKKTGIVAYFKGYDKTLSMYLLYWVQNNVLNLCEANRKSPVTISIPKENIITIVKSGEVVSYSSVKGGGVSVGGAIVGAAIAGPVGAVLGGRKKVKSTTVTTDSRRVILQFKENNVEKSLLLGYSIYDELCLFCADKVTS